MVDSGSRGASNYLDLWLLAMCIPAAGSVRLVMIQHDCGTAQS